MTGAFTESVVEEAALGWLEELEYSVPHGPDFAAGMPAAEQQHPGYQGVALSEAWVMV